MIMGNGIDIVSTLRIKKAIEKNMRFINRVFTKKEIEYFKEKNYSIETIAGYFASKEAISKVLGCGIGKIGWHDITIRNNKKGKPLVCLSQKATDYANSKNIKHIHLTITHNKDYAVANAIGEDKEPSEFIFDNENTNSDPLITMEYVRSKLVQRKKNSHKGNFGRVGIIAGSVGFSGAAYLTAKASIKSGAGLVYSVLPNKINMIMEMKTTETITIPVQDDDKGFFTKDSIDEILTNIDKFDVIALGPGIGVDKNRKDLVREILKQYKNTIVLDADGINCIDDVQVLKKREAPTIITPHPGEMARLLKVTINQILENKIYYTQMISKYSKVLTILKGHRSLVDIGEEQYYNTTGNPGMATAGSGDVLTGIIASLVAQGFKPTDAANMGVFIHGLAGDMAANKKGEYGMTSVDILENVPYAMKYINRWR
ncbi:NAD(P)H-hydrate dehydratase [Clostridiaceae bacterium M8S5]|nr:NAD(P)H-hydrate dehydratase [Clostridiaceae bacterium M8S5]